MHRRDDLLRLRQGRLLEVFGIVDRDLHGADPGDRRVQFIEGLLDDPGADLGGQTSGVPGLVDHHHPVRLAHRRHDRRVIQRPQHPQIDDLAIDPGRGQPLGCIQGLGNGSS